MNQFRWMYLESHREAELMQDEIDEGWHWCPDWDYLLVGPGMDELEGCTCRRTMNGKDG